MTRISLLFAILLGLLAVPVTAGAQIPEDWDPKASYVSRDTLEALGRRMELAAESPGYSETLRSRANDEAAAIRTRLETGDFRVGDQIYLYVELETALQDTFTVDANRVVPLPEIGDVPMAGVLRSELQDVFSEYLSQYIRNPVVRARSLIPLTVLGGGGSTGFFTFPSEMRFTSLLNQVGGPGSEREFNRIRIVRNGNTVIGGSRLRELATAGVTLDQLGLQAGDQVVMPLTTSRDVYTTVRTFTLLLTVPFTILGLIAVITP